MRAIVLALSLALAVPAVGVLGACSTISGPMSRQEALYAAVLAYEGALDTVKAAADSGLLKGENAVKAKDILNKANTALQLARTTQDASLARQVLIILATLEPLTNG
jgi:hypothetical protein